MTTEPTARPERNPEPTPPPPSRPPVWWARSPTRPRTNGPIGLAAAGICFAVVLAAIGWAIHNIVNHS